MRWPACGPGSELRWAPTVAEPFKLLIHAGTVAAMGHHLQRAWPAFERERFESLANTGLDALEFKARAMQLADALEATLPPEFAAAADVIEASLAPPLPLDDRGEPVSLADRDGDQGLSGWAVWSLGVCITQA